MLGNIISIIDNTVLVKLTIDMTTQVNLVNIHVVFEDDASKIVGEIIDIDKTDAKINIVGELLGDSFVPGFNKKPAFKSKVRLITLPELEVIFGKQEITDTSQIHLGLSTIYSNYRINVNVNQFFSNHFAILGNTGSGKSFTLSRILQNIFSSKYSPIASNFVIFDAYGEYTNAFSKISEANPNIRYKNVTTNVEESNGELLNIPLWLLGTDDIAQLLGVTSPNQLPIIEKALKLVPILKSEDETVLKSKNDIIARAIMDILSGNNDSVGKRDQVTAVLTSFHTKDLSLTSQIVQPGYTRTLKQLLFVDKTGKMQEMELVVDFVSKFISDEPLYADTGVMVPYTLKDLEQAMEFSLISEGILKSDKVYDEANVLSVRLHSLVESEVSKYFDYPKMISREDYVKLLMTTNTGEKAQINNININYVDDRIAKAITKILSKMIFDYAVNNKQRGSVPFHIIIEEAHRYVQNDSDVYILGYNIFDRITKEGRKYGVLLGLITQRPSELSETSISQCTNFIILRTLHPKDLEYIRNMVPAISNKVMDDLKSLQPGNAIAFGSAFKIPVSIHIQKPDPEPLSNNVNLQDIWYKESNFKYSETQTNYISQEQLEQMQNSLINKTN